MGRTGFERISQREYGRRLGVSNETIRKAIEAGKISKGWDKKEGKILFEKANEEWGNLYLKPDEGVAEIIEHLNKSGAKGTEQPAENIPTPAAPRSKIKVDPDDTEAGALLELQNFNLNSKTPFAEALRVQKVAQAQKEVIELEKLIGTLVVKDDVYKQLFAFGQEVRQGLMVIPDRCIDSVIAAKNRSEAHSILLKEIHQVLEKLTSPKLEFQPRD